MNNLNTRRQKLRYITYKTCQKQTPQSKTNQCKRCQSTAIPNAREGINNNEGKDIEQIRMQLGSIARVNQGINEKNQDIINQGFIDSKKYEGNVRFLSLNP